MSLNVDLNADIGESFGRYSVGNDAELMGYVTSVSIACGYHAGDPNVMRSVTNEAVRKHMNIGAHPGLPDILGFGRRKLNISPEELRNYVIYQAGALDGFLSIHKQSIKYIKPHGAMYRMVEESEEYAEAICNAIMEYNPEIALVTEAGKVSEKLAIRNGIRVIREAFPDLEYDENGDWVIERNKRNRSPEEVAERALSMVLKNKITLLNGKEKEIKADTLCLHGDSPNVVNIAKAVRSALENNAVEVYSF